MLWVSCFFFASLAFLRAFDLTILLPRLFRSAGSAWTRKRAQQREVEENAVPADEVKKGKKNHKQRDAAVEEVEETDPVAEEPKTNKKAKRSQ